MAYYSSKRFFAFFPPGLGECKALRRGICNNSAPRHVSNLNGPMRIENSVLPDPGIQHNLRAECVFVGNIFDKREECLNK